MNITLHLIDELSPSEILNADVVCFSRAGEESERSVQHCVQAGRWEIRGWGQDPQAGTNTNTLTQWYQYLLWVLEC